MSPTPTPTPLAEWSRRLRNIAAPVLAETPLLNPADPATARAFAEDFADEFGHQRLYDRYLLSHLLGFTIEGPPREPWLGLWAALCAPVRPQVALGTPPLVASPEAWALEQETEKELSGLHAAWWLVPAPELDAASAWVIANIQPDNATNRPWAIHVFLERAERLGDADARMYAEQLLHNCIVATGKPDLLSAIILVHAAKGLKGAEDHPTASVGDPRS